MFNIIHTESIILIRKWLDDISYSTLNSCIMQFLDQTGELYPNFSKFTSNITRVNPLYAFIFSVFRLGQPTERSYLDYFIPAKVIGALIETGLLEDKDKYYQMPEVGILPLRGMYFVTPLPEIYPTISQNSRFKPVDQSVLLIMDEIVSQPAETNFLEINADFGLLANMAAVKGFKNLRILPKDTDYIPFIQLNLALNHHVGEVVSHNDSRTYDLIAGINLSVKEKVENRDLKFSDEKEIIHFFSMCNLLKENGQAIFLLESLGTIGNITVNEQLKAKDGFNVKSVVLDKIPYQSLLLSAYVQSSWEKQFELTPREYVNYVRKITECSDSKVFVFKQLLKIKKRKNSEAFILYPFYNPKYTDPTYNYAALTV